MQIVVLDAYTANPGDLTWDALKQLGDVVLYERTAPDLVVSRSCNADVVLTNKVVLDSSKIDSLPNLKYIGVLATGTNVVDLAYARAKNIVVTNIPSYSTESVVQTTFAHILNLAASLAINTSAVRSGAWIRCADFSFSLGRLTELSGKRLGVVGLGTIGRRVAQIASAFGMDVVAYGPRLVVGEKVGCALATSLDDLFKTSDIVSLHCPLTKDTDRLVNAKRLSSMKRGAWLINTGRGPLLDEQAVAEALETGQLGGVGVDVLSTEPPKEDNPLLCAPNCYITPHNAWASYEARVRLIKIATENVAAFIKGEKLNVVN